MEMEEVLVRLRYGLDMLRFGGGYPMFIFVLVMEFFGIWRITVTVQSPFSLENIKNMRIISKKKLSLGRPSNIKEKLSFFFLIFF
jgi:hypothetical protein